MAKVNNIFKITGKLDNKVFYKRNGQYLVRENTSGFADPKVQSHPNVQATQHRFAEVSSFMIQLKTAIYAHLSLMNDGTFHNQLMSWCLDYRKRFKEESFYNIFQSLQLQSRLRTLQLNKNWKISLPTIHFDPINHQITLEGYIDSNFTKISSQKFLKVSLGWLGISPNNVIEIQSPEIVFIPLESSSVVARTVLDFPIGQLNNQLLHIPVISYVIVHEPYPDSPSVHAVQSMNFHML